MANLKTINTETLRNWLEAGKEVSLFDIRPIQERIEWFISQSIYIDANDKLKAHNPIELEAGANRCAIS